MWEHVLEGVTMVLQWENLLWAMAGVGFGMLLGAIPGLSGSIGIVLLLPFTFYLGPIPGIAMLMGLSKGDGFGGSIPAILFNIPGTPHALITTFDGYPLTRQGKAGKALDTALMASFTADVTSDLVLIFLAAPVAAMALKIGPPEYTMLILFSLVLIALAASDNPTRGLLSCGLGLFVSSVGLDPEHATDRLTFGILELSDGIPLMPMAIGLMALAELFRQAELDFFKKARGEAVRLQVAQRTGRREDERLSFKEYCRLFPTIMRSTAIGAFIGIVPGIGTTVASYLSYMTAKRRSKNPETFGKGALEGLASCEAGNNAVNGPNLIPLVTLGIPGNLAAALILGGFMIKGLTPGPTFMERQAPLLYALFTVLLLSNLFTLAFGKLAIRHAHRLTAIQPSVLHGSILTLCALGCYVTNSSTFDYYIMFASCIAGYVFILCRFNLPVFLVSYLLGNLLEHKLRQTLLLSGGDYSIFLTRPISLAFLVFTVATIAYFIYRNLHRHRVAQPQGDQHAV